MALRETKEFFCPICFEIFKNPVLLSCGHSVCKDCVQTWWADKPVPMCPVCRRRHLKRDPPCNLALKNLCEAFLQELSLKDKDCSRSEDLCSQHSETLKFFCFSHLQPVCVVCRDSEMHTNHSFRPISEAAQEYRDWLRKSLKPLQEKLERLSQIKVDWDQTTEHIKVQAKYTEKWIKDEFQKLHVFLQKEEEARVAALRKEEEQKRHMMEQRTEALSIEIAALSETIRTTEEALVTADVTFLQTYKALVERLQQCPLLDEPQMASGALIDIAKHVGNLTFNTWNKMKDMVSYTPVILDANTANSYLLLSEDLRSVRHGATERQLSKIPERMDYYLTVLGCESFNSGTHSWEVEVIDNANWAVGVIEESVHRKLEILNGYWEIWFNNGKYIALSPPHKERALSVKNPLRRIRVHLDWDKGKVSFFDADTNTKIHSFYHTFTEGLFPYINTLSTVPLRILPRKITVQLNM